MSLDRSRDEYLEMVKGPGKFEGCAPYVPYFWDAWLNGFADEAEWEGETEISVFNVTDEDRSLFPELAGIATVRLLETEQGFVLEV